MTIPNASATASSSSPTSSRWTPDLYVKEPVYIPTSRTPSSFSPAHHSDYIIVDNGSSNLRAGFSSQHAPFIDEPNLVSKYTSRKSTKNLLFGRDTEVDPTSRIAQRSAFDGDILVNFDVLESALDYTFHNLLTSFPNATPSNSNGVSHPILMAERLATPLFSRLVTSELLFEAYNAPSVTFGIDSLFGFEAYWARKAGILPGSPGPNAKGSGQSGGGRGKSAKKREGSSAEGKNGLVLCLGNAGTSVIPVVNGKGVMGRAKRIPWGGSQASELTLKLAQLKYPGFPTRVTPSQATYMFHETAYFSSSYLEETESLSDPAALCAIDKVCQFDFVLPEVNLKTDEELAAQAEKRKENGKRLQEMQARQRAEKYAERDLQLLTLKDLIESKAKLSEDDYALELIRAGYEEESEVIKQIRTMETATKKTRVRIGGEDEVDEIEEPSFPLVDTPDEELNDEQIKEKRKQRLLKASYDARMRLKAEKLAEKARMDEIARLDDETREADPVAWSNRLKVDHSETIDRIKERKKTRALLNDRKSAVAQNRMKSIAALASDSPPPKRRKKNVDDDGFGDDDADWAVYREIEGAEDQDAEAEDLALIAEIEAKLLTHDPTFAMTDTFASLSTRQSPLISAFLRGNSQPYDPDDMAQNYQLHLNVERLRVPETWFQPGIAGVDSAGVGEIAGWLLNGFGEEERRRMMQCIYVTGGSAQIPGFVPRLRSELTSLLPFRGELNIVTSWDSLSPAEKANHDPRHEAWKGMASWSGTEEAKKVAVSKAEWEENGGDWIKEHRWSNWLDEEPVSGS